MTDSDRIGPDPTVPDLEAIKALVAKLGCFENEETCYPHEHDQALRELRRVLGLTSDQPN
jgi:hypothetical protein